MSIATLVSRIDEARSGVQRARETLSGARGKAKPAEETSPQKQGGMSASDIGHTVLDVAGLIPVVGTAADLINAGWYAAEGDYANAGLSALGAVPGIGDAATVAKLGVKGADVAVTAAKAADGVASAAKTSGKGSKRSHIVYTLRDQNNNVKYVGSASGNGTPKQVMQGRISRGHDHIKANPHYKPHIESTQSSKKSMRGAEDVLYNYHKNAQGVPLDNKIPPLSDKPWKARRGGRAKVDAWYKDNAPETGLYHGEQLD
jgi:hypothetical protein